MLSFTAGNRRLVIGITYDLQRTTAKVKTKMIVIRFDLTARDLNSNSHQRLVIFKITVVTHGILETLFPCKHDARAFIDVSIAHNIKKRERERERKEKKKEK